MEEDIFFQDYFTSSYNLKNELELLLNDISSLIKRVTNREINRNLALYKCSKLEDWYSSLENSVRFFRAEKLAVNDSYESYKDYEYEYFCSSDDNTIVNVILRKAQHVVDSLYYCRQIIKEVSILNIIEDINSDLEIYGISYVHLSYFSSTSIVEILCDKTINYSDKMVPLPLLTEEIKISDDFNEYEMNILLKNKVFNLI